MLLLTELMDPNLLSILVCPNCKGKLVYEAQRQRLVCVGERLAFRITDSGIPVLLADEAEDISREGDLE